MAEDTSKEKDIWPNLSAATSGKKDTEIQKKKQAGVISRIWNSLLRVHGDDFGKRLQHISKEEASVLARMKIRTQSWRRMIRHLIVLSVVTEVIVVGYPIRTARSLDLNWKMRAFNVFAHVPFAWFVFYCIFGPCKLH